MSRSALYALLVVLNSGETTKLYFFNSLALLAIRVYHPFKSRRHLEYIFGCVCISIVIALVIKCQKYVLMYKNGVKFPSLNAKINITQSL